MDSPHLPAIAEFFRDREIFITGGTGFVGKAIIEKILYSCPEISKIYLLVRCKKGVGVSERLEKFKSNQIFNRIREKDAKLLDKLIPLAGDSMSLQLGLSNEDLAKMENVSVIINSAASVRFDEPLRDAIFMNTRSARELVVIAEKLKNLKVLVHISTTYCNPGYEVIEEKIYPPLADWRQTIKLAENMDGDTLEILAAKYMDFQPNTYTFTKSLAEQIMKENSDRLPIIIFRPSIISPSVKEPFTGWVDNFNGVTGILAAGGSGLARVLYGCKTVLNNFQPLDVCVRSLLVATWKRGLGITSQMTIYNCACSKEKELKSEDLFHHCYTIASDIPLDEMVWFPNATITACYVFYKITLILFQVIPGIFFDLIFRIIRKKPIALSIMRKFHFASSSLSYFMFRDWFFVNDNCFNLMNDIKYEDMEEFGFDFYEGMEMKEYMYQSSMGGRRFLMRQKDEDLPRARRNYRIFWFLDRALKTVFWLGVLWFLVVRYDVLNFNFKRSLLG
ncbi:putative fatty acyl-CoA reductase CG5065 [Lutzomyia longipalpis]|uniref:putative fatty acyl-CoA reductase CG5065 n=1 Tax=Lutzomyia longipalpis TaxID=7200 RepID=UPI002483887D|nr:putative fatty acyl-CoA reductase CG5065 [Lutzomyia longipalpis]